jgi:hypothetical protein
MPVYPLVFAPPVKTGRYIHMARRDLVVWERWLDRHPRDYDGVAYDVALGGVSPAAYPITDADRTGYQYSNALKIDALLNKAGQWRVAEVRPECSPSAIGSALCYRVMLAREYPEQADVRPLVICEFASRDMFTCADALGVEIEAV